MRDRPVRTGLRKRGNEKDDLRSGKRTKKDTVVHADPKETSEKELEVFRHSSVATVVGSEINETGEWVKINSGNVGG